MISTRKARILQTLEDAKLYDDYFALRDYFEHHDNSPNLALIQQLVQLAKDGFLAQDKAEAAVEDLFDHYMTGRKLA